MRLVGRRHLDRYRVRYAISVADADGQIGGQPDEHVEDHEDQIRGRGIAAELRDLDIADADDVEARFGIEVAAGDLEDRVDRNGLGR